MKSILYVFIFLLPLIASANSEAIYHKEYYGNNVLKAEGWLKDGEKVKYWKFYRPNGKIKSEGHYTAGKKSMYWFFYQANGEKLKEGSFTND